jgi:phosphatidylglycerophosphatase A
MEAGQLNIRPFTCKITFPDPESETLKCVRDAGQSFHMLPRAYYGIVKRIYMDLIFKKTGSYFPGVSPDMAAAISIATVAKNICHIDYPLFVPGSSAQSNAGLGALKKHIGLLRDQLHLPATCERDWSDIVPAFYSVQTIWAESTVSALKAMKKSEILKQFNVPLLFATCLVFHPRYMFLNNRSLFRSLKLLRQGAITGITKFIYWFFYWWTMRLKFLLFRFFKPTKPAVLFSQKGIMNIDEAVQSVTHHLKKIKIEFNNCKNNIRR